jgi:hypothetical protein
MPWQELRAIAVGFMLGVAVPFLVIGGYAVKWWLGW